MLSCVCVCWVMSCSPDQSCKSGGLLVKGLAPESKILDVSG